MITNRDSLGFLANSQDRFRLSDPEPITLRLNGCIKSGKVAKQNKYIHNPKHVLCVIWAQFLIMAWLVGHTRRRMILVPILSVEIHKITDGLDTWCLRNKENPVEVGRVSWTDFGKGVKRTMEWERRNVYFLRGAGHHCMLSIIMSKNLFLTKIGSLKRAFFIAILSMI